MPSPATHKRPFTSPEIAEMPLQKMAVVHTVGDPDRVMHLVLPALYSSIHALNRDLRRVGRDFRLGNLRVRLPDAHLVPKEQWHGVWGLPIPKDIDRLPQSFPHVVVEIETWDYGTVAQLTHADPSSEEEPDIDYLETFITGHRYEIAGPLEEEYLAGPTPPVQKVIVRYPVRLQSITAALGPVQEHSLALAGSI